MRLNRLLITMIASSLVGQSSYSHPVPKGKWTVPKGVTVIEFPGDKLLIGHARTPRGPVVRVESENRSIEARRLFVGDGREAFEFEADDEWVQLLHQDGGRANHRWKDRASFGGLSYTLWRGKSHSFDRMKAGDIYIIAPTFKLKVRD